ncbi:MAG: NAD/NADP octopine/nopaline dehydrogenase family protein [Anaerovoracaceae bacterium]|jgi:opine dehydrogenase
MKAAILGSGNGAHATAFEWSKAGHDVWMFDFPEFADIEKIAAKGGIECQGEMSGFAPVAYAGSDIERVLSGADLVFAIGPAYSTEAFAEACRPYAKDGQVYIVCPASFSGAIVFKQGLGLDLLDERIVVAETSTLPYAARIVEPGTVFIHNRLKGGLYIAALPSSCNERVFEMVRGVHDTMELVDNVWQTSFQNANPVIHPAITLLNVALIERTGGNFLFYEEGVTPAVGRLVKAVDDEKIAIGAKLGVTIMPDTQLGMLQGYQAVDSYDIGYSTAPGYKGIMAQTSLDYRYFNEDVGYGLVFMTDFARHIGVETPIMDSIINIVSVLMERDYRAEGARTLAGLGLDQYDLQELVHQF